MNIIDKYFEIIRTEDGSYIDITKKEQKELLKLLAIKFVKKKKKSKKKKKPKKVGFLEVSNTGEVDEIFSKTSDELKTIVKEYPKDRNKISRKRLTPEEQNMYAEIGVVDMSQNWLELFDDDIIFDINTIIHASSDNQLKARAIFNELEYMGFEWLGLGTNILTLFNSKYTGVVFKIALDDFGMADNLNDAILQDLVDHTIDSPIPRFTRMVARHPSSLVSVQERKIPIMSENRMVEFYGDIMNTLIELSKQFLICDMSPSNFMNYGIERNGDWCFIDASDIYPLNMIDGPLRCKKPVDYNSKKSKMVLCGGTLEYNEDFTRVVCTKCGHVSIPFEHRPKNKGRKKKMNVSDGYTAEEANAMSDRLAEAILLKNPPEERIVCRDTTGETRWIPERIVTEAEDDDIDDDDEPLYEEDVDDDDIDDDDIDEEDDDEEDEEYSLVPTRQMVETSPQMFTKEELSITVVNVNDGVSDLDPGIYINVKPGVNFVDAYADNAVPIYLNIDGEISQVMNTQALLDNIIDNVESALEYYDE